MSFLKSSYSNMRCDFKSSSFFSDVMEYAGFAVVAELGSDGAMLPWFLLVMILCLPLAISLSLVLAVLAVSIFSVLQACVFILLGFPFSPMPSKQLVFKEVSGDGGLPCGRLDKVQMPCRLLFFKCSAAA